MPGQGPQDFIFQHPLKPEGGPEGDIPIMSFLSVNCICPKYPKTDVKISITLGTSFQHLLDPKAGPEGGIRKCQ